MTGVLKGRFLEMGLTQATKYTIGTDQNLRTVALPAGIEFGRFNSGARPGVTTKELRLNVKLNALVLRQMKGVTTRVVNVMHRGMEEFFTQTHIGESQLINALAQHRLQVCAQ
jgi:hypothetical protein